MKEFTLSHERLDAYQIAIQFLAWSTVTVGALPRGHSVLADQLRRATMSIPLNIAEAVGKMTLADRARFFSIARGSALECAAIIDVCTHLNLVKPNRAASGKQLLARTAAMLTKLCLSASPP